MLLRTIIFRTSAGTKRSSQAQHCSLLVSTITNQNTARPYVTFFNFNWAHRQFGFGTIQNNAIRRNFICGTNRKCSSPVFFAFSDRKMIIVYHSSALIVSGNFKAFGYVFANVASVVLSKMRIGQTIQTRLASQCSDHVPYHTHSH